MKMKLEYVQVTNFRSVEDSEKFKIDDLTCLVGKNEAGKTAILQALQALRPYGKAQSDFSIIKEYPRRFQTRYKERHSGTDATAIKTWWSLSDEAKNALIAEFGEESIVGSQVTISKIYNHGGTTWYVPVDEESAVSHFISKSNFDAAETAQIGDQSRFIGLRTKIEGLENPTEKQKALIDKIKKFRGGRYMKHAIDVIDPFVPHFFYVSHYDRMNGQISAEKLSEDIENEEVEIGDSIFLNFLELAGTSLEDLVGAEEYEELKAKCEAASNDISGQIFEYWTQNDALDVQLDFSEGRTGDKEPFDSGTVVRARVYNRLHRASVPFSERSAGVVWFFSFLVQFAALRKSAGRAIVLLDEPGLTLHGKAQADLLRYFEEKLIPHHQVIFSTHSPFMVPANSLSSVRVVEDKLSRDERNRPVIHGTKVSEDALTTDRDTIFPLQGALGYDIVQSLFVGKNTLLVEGPSDILYIQALSDALKRSGRLGLNTTEWTICPSGGIDKIRSFVSLFSGNNLNVAVLTDFAKRDRTKLENLRASEILQADKIITFADFLNQQEADVEDVFDAKLFSKILNAAYDIPDAKKITAAKLGAETSTERQVYQAEALFRLIPEVNMLDHFTPSAYLLRHPELLDGKDTEVIATLDIAQNIFDKINSFLPD